MKPRSLVDAALLDQERRILQTHPRDLVDRRWWRRLDSVQTPEVEQHDEPQEGGAGRSAPPAQ